MAHRTEKSVFYHIARTGGIWVKQAMRASGLELARCAECRTSAHKFGLVREHATPDGTCFESKRGLFSFCFVRRPESWYRSFWCFRSKTRYLDKKFPLDRIWDDEFERFVTNSVEKFPDGFVTELFQYYVGKVDFVGRQEDLANDLVRVLTLVGEEFDVGALRSTRRYNVAAADERYGGMCTLSEATRDRMLEAEKWVTDTFYA